MAALTYRLLDDLLGLHARELTGWPAFASPNRSPECGADSTLKATRVRADSRPGRRCARQVTRAHNVTSCM